MTMVANATEDDVVLKSKDGRSWITGTIVSVIDGSYIVKTRFGEMVVDRDLVDCEGVACPKAMMSRNDVAITGADKKGE